MIFHVLLMFTYIHQRSGRGSEDPARLLRDKVAWASYQIRKIAGCACAGNAGNVSPRRRFQRKPLVGDPGMHHGTCVTHVPWCMSGSLTCGDGENVPGIPGACAPATLRIWQEAHTSRYLTPLLLCFAMPLLLITMYVYINQHHIY